MADKYEDLVDKISDVLEPGLAGYAYIRNSLRWLDNHRDQTPGQTITESELETMTNDLATYSGPVPGTRIRVHLAHIGVTVVPDPEPTDVEKITRLILENSTDMDPKFIAEMLVENGVRPMNAGGDEPDAEHNRDWWVKNANVNDAEDCEACVDDLCPVHHGIALGIEFVTKKIAALGEDPELFNSIPNPPKAPGGDDDQ